MNTTWSTILRRETPHWLVIAAMFVASTLAWGDVTGPVPVHWNIRGEVDGYGSRMEALLLVPAIALGMYLLLLLLPRIDPARANYASFTGPYALMRAALTASMAGMHALVLATALGYAVDAGRWIPVGVGALLVVLGNILGKVRPNYFVGIRTPWTLSSARSWEKTHRAGGRLFVAVGIALATAAIIGAPRLLVGVMILGGGALLWLVYYSWAEWRADPARVPASGTAPAAEERPGESRGR